MRRIRRIFCSLVVLATAASTLLANVPLAVCACSPVPVNQNARSEETSPSSCCCGNHCCPSTSNERSCCTPKATPKPTAVTSSPAKQKEMPTNEPTIKAPDCQQAVAPTKTFSIEQRHGNANDVVILVHSAAVEPICHLRSGIASPLTWQVHRVPPPTDLVVAFQHFVI
jgi:hypothetical protein